MNSIVTCLQVENDPTLLLLAATVCVIGVYGSFSVSKHAGRSEGAARRKWAAVAIVAAGSTAWATHMIALLAFQPGMLSAFEPFLTALSLLLAVLGIGLGLAITIGRLGRGRRFVGGVIIGSGVALLHYVGQAAYFVTGVVHWDPGLVAFSIVAGLPLFGLSVVVAGERNRTVRLAGAPLLVLSIAVLHLSGMAAMDLEYNPAIRLPRLAVPPEVLAPIVAAVCFGVLSIAVLGLRFSLHAKAELRRERIRLGELANLALEGLAICEGDQIISANDSLARLIGWSRDELVGRTLKSLLPGIDALSMPEHEEADARLVCASGSTLPVRILLSEVRLGGRPQVVVAFRDQRERLRSEEKIRALAFSDPLTGLANRTRFHETLAEKVDASRDADTPFTLLMIDLDGFKAVNDMLGHAAGDEVLSIVAKRILSVIDCQHMAARLGGDEFGVLISNSADPMRAARIGQEIIAAIEVPIEVQQQLMYISASIGIMPSQTEALDADAMLTAADLALYDAKGKGRARVRLFTPELRRASIERSGIAQELHDAWNDGSFELYYQPQVDLAGGHIVGAEALLRWNYPYCGVLAPAAFLSVLERSHLAVPVGNWILQSACRQAMELRRAGLPSFKVGVNLFAAQLRSADFVEQVEEALRVSGLPASALELEVIENIVLLDDRMVADHLKRIRRKSVGIAFDDFGTGFASLSMLKKLDISRLKIDRSFVSEIETSRKDQGIVDAVTRMAEGCDLAVIAEGIETEAQARYLRSRVVEGQGYLFGKPMPFGTFKQRFAANSPVGSRLSA
ncbi:bifunctional diguanylate cyclase/phosphodiesterase [Mangrovicella endophytica]|uniref:bifunctional diguanylate cyclase/phosphodiesterase n=1 Tax=Mangrovicella endophytica TaxID=2066697 RepID=UPI000C9E539F|nr:EAL domain-containing protein [Mangrovicella endophytica]